MSHPWTRSVNALVHRGLDDLDFGQALFTIGFYARRNFICHGKIFDLFTSKTFAGLTEYINADYKILESVLQMSRSYWFGKYRNSSLNFRGIDFSSSGKCRNRWAKGARPAAPRLLKVRGRAISVPINAVHQRVKMQKEGAFIGRELQDARQRLAEAEEVETVKTKEEFEREKTVFRAMAGRNVGTTSTHRIGTKHVARGSISTDDTGSEVGDDNTGGRIKRRH